MPNTKNKDLMELAWNYFNFHASQRLTTFNFYIVISALLTTGLLNIYQNKDPHLIADFGLSLLLYVLSIIFLMLDKRNQGLIELAESALIDYENTFRLPKSTGKEPNRRAIFSREHYKSGKDPAPTILGITVWRYRYSNCFGAIFFSFGMVGVTGMSWTILQFDLLSGLCL